MRLQDSTLNPFWSIYTESFNSSGNLLFVNGLGIGAWLRRSDGVFVDGSDARLKRDIAPLGRVLDRVLKLRPVSYRLRNAPPDAPLTLGLIAQEVEPLFPEVLDKHQGMRGSAYSQFVPVTLSAIQELNQKLEETRAELKRRDAENAELRARLEKLEQWMAEKPGNAR